MEKLTIAEAKRLNDTMVTEDHLKLHAANVAACMGAMAEHFGADKEHWEAVGYLHDYDYEKYPEEHLAHTEEPLREAGVPEEDIRAILSHGYSICTDVEPRSDMEKSLFTVDELSGIIQAAARMRPSGIVDMSLKSLPRADPAGLRDAGHGDPGCRGTLYPRNAGARRRAWPGECVNRQGRIAEIYRGYAEAHR